EAGNAGRGRVCRDERVAHDAQWQARRWPAALRLLRLSGVGASAMTRARKRRRAPVATERTDGARMRAQAEFRQIIDSLGSYRGVVFGGGKGFGSTALKINGK